MSKRTYLITLAWITFCAALLRYVELATFPLRLDGDAARFSLEGAAMMRNQAPFFATGWEGHTHAWFYIVGWVTRIVDNPALGVRILSATAGTLSVATTAYFAYSLSKNLTISLIAAAAIALSPLHLVFSRNGMELAWGTALLPLILALMMSRYTLAWVVAGILTACAQYIAMSLRIAPLAVILLLVILTFHKQIRVKQCLLQIAIWGAVTLAVYAPQLWYFAHNPEAYWARIDRVSIFTSSHMSELLDAHSSYLAVAWHQVTHAYFPFFLKFDGATNLWYFYLPYLNPIPMVFFAWGILYALFRIRQWQMQYLLSVLLGAIFLASVLTMYPPMSSRYVILLPFVSMMIAYGLFKSFHFLSRTAPNRTFMISTLFGITMILAICADVLQYTQHDTQTVWEHDKTTQTASLITHYLWANPQIATLYTPFPELLFPTVPSYTNVEVVQASALPPDAPYASALFIPASDIVSLETARQKHNLQTIHTLSNPLGHVLGYILLP